MEENLFSQVTISGYAVIIRIMESNYVLKINLGGLFDLLPIFVYIGVLEDFKQPCFCISSFLVLIYKPVCLEVGLLDQVISILLVVGQVIGKVSE